MARIPTVDVIVNSESAVETAQSGRGMVSVMPTAGRAKVYKPTPLRTGFKYFLAEILQR